MMLTGIFNINKVNNVCLCLIEIIFDKTIFTNYYAEWLFVISTLPDIIVRYYKTV